MKRPEELAAELLTSNTEHPPESNEEALLRVVDIILDDRKELTGSIAKACGSPNIHQCPCGQEYYFFPTTRGKMQPIVPEEGISHFATCADAEHFRDVI